MKPYSAFRNLRKKTKLSMREFSKESGIALSVLVSLQNGKHELTSIPLCKAILIFRILGADLQDFYYTYYPELKNDVDILLSEREKERREELVLYKLERKIYNRLIKLKERKRIEINLFDELCSEKEDLFFQLDKAVDKKGLISPETYESLVAPFIYKIGAYMEDSSPDEDKIKNPVSKMINDRMMFIGMSYSYLARIINITPRRLTMCKKSPEGYEKMRIGTFLKLCYAINVDFKELTDMYVDNKHALE